MLSSVCSRVWRASGEQGDSTVKGQVESGRFISVNLTWWPESERKMKTSSGRERKTSSLTPRGQRENGIKL
ncbi:hypothetical protein MHYP_G00045920 [Metynnis hypsauchen]